MFVTMLTNQIGIVAILGKYLVQILARIPAIMTETFFLTVHANTGKIPQNRS
jgi:hypothetical protein